MNRISVQRHEEWRNHLRQKEAFLNAAPVGLHDLLTDEDFDEIEEIFPDAKPAAMRREGDVRRLLSLLDEIGKGGDRE